MDKLKPCPFCGGRAILAERCDLRPYKYLVHCKNCTAEINQINDAEYAIKT